MRHVRALDGLRGVAVAAVVLFHFLPGEVPGGFLGVDVFFVLSGFLITSLVVGEVSTTRGLDLGRFWVRRARRLLPALVLVLTALVAYATWAATPGELSRLRSHGLATLGYFANWRYIAEGVSYTELVLGASPLVHTWSLAIEEQFYVLFPAIALLAVWSARRDPIRVRWLLGAVACIGILASATAMAIVHDPGADPSRVYYGTDTRIHVLLVGVVLGAVLAGRPPTHGRAGALAAAGGVAAAAALVVALAFAHETDTWLYRGGFLGVALLVAAVIAGSCRSRILGAILGGRPLVGLGQISYGVYLWHWPVFVVLDEPATGLRDVGLFALRIVVTLVVSLASYWLVEQPIRRGALGRRFGRPAIVAAPVAAVALAALLVPATALPPSLGRGAAADPAAIAQRPDSTAPLRAVVAGDSVAHTLAGGVVYEFPDFAPWDPSQSPFDPTRLEIWNAAKPACTYLPGATVVPRPGGGYGTIDRFHRLCGAWQTDLSQVLAQLRPDFLVVLLANETGDLEVDGRLVTFASAEHDGLLGSVLDEFRLVAEGVGARLVLVTPAPRTGASAGGHDEGGWREVRTREVIMSYAQANGVGVLDLAEAICPGADCDVPPEGFDPEMRYDGLHFTAEGARWVARWTTFQLERLARTGPPPPPEVAALVSSP